MSDLKKYTHDIGVIIVLYYPDINTVIENVKRLLFSVGKICIIDNTPDVEYSNEFNSFKDITYIANNQNLGIAKAQNIGIEKFIKDPNIEYLLFLDQDSQINPSITSQLKENFIALSKKFNVIAVGPQAIDKATNSSYVATNSIYKKIILHKREYWVMRNIPSSYSLTRKENFINYGLYAENLFIDCVEHEWFWRVKFFTEGDLYIIPWLNFSHQMGTPAKIFHKNVSVSSPFRLYYQIRNVIWVSRLKYTPKSWIKRQRRRLVLKCFLYPILFKPRFKYLKSIIRGLKDGILKHF